MSNGPLSSRWLVAASCVFSLACTHSDSLTVPAESVGPAGFGADVQLTFNSGQDYWPAWTEDGRGILYAYVDGTNAPAHRCIGLLPATGGTRIWQWCDDRATEADSVSSFTGYALGSDGRLLYMEAAARSGAQSGTPVETTLWLADSSAPFRRRALLSGITRSLADIEWTGLNTFIALSQSFELADQCLFCSIRDSVWEGEGVVIGTITAAGATLQPVAGTEGASNYAIADSGATVVFVRKHDLHLFSIPVGGGTATSVAEVATGSNQLLGVSCRLATCVVAADPVMLTPSACPAVAGGPIAVFACVGSGPRQLRTVSLNTGTVQVVATSPAVLATPKFSPVSGDLVVQLGGTWGHLQTLTPLPGDPPINSDLHLYKGLVP